MRPRSDPKTRSFLYLTSGLSSTLRPRIVCRIKRLLAQLAPAWTPRTRPLPWNQLPSHPQSRPQNHQPKTPLVFQSGTRAAHSQVDQLGHQARTPRLSLPSAVFTLGTSFTARAIGSIMPCWSVCTLIFNNYADSCEANRASHVYSVSDPMGSICD
jgi:hypothetical protein